MTERVSEPRAAPEPRATRLGRLADYLGEMFPPAVVVPYGASIFAAIYFALHAFAGRGPIPVTWRAWCGAATVVLFLLLLRVYDELKDVETDLRLGRAGDPRYKDRAIVTGRVREEDLVWLRWAVTLLLWAINLPLGFPWPGAAFLGAFALTWLSLKWFFWPAVSRNLLLAFVTHNPMTLAVVGYVVALYARDFGTAGLSWSSVVPLALAIWLPLAAWEVSRKVRHPDDETDYQTYSKMLGARVAGALPAVLVAGGVACLVIAARRAGLGWIYPGVALGAAALAVVACLRFVLAPSSAASKLRPVFELYSLVATFGFALSLAIRYGIELAFPYGQ